MPPRIWTDFDVALKYLHVAARCFHASGDVIVDELGDFMSLATDAMLTAENENLEYGGEENFGEQTTNVDATLMGQVS
jgi:hypothetical protein